MRPPRPSADTLAAGLAGALLAGLPSTIYTLWRGEDVLEGARAAGSIALGPRAPGPALIAAAVPVHLALSLGWAAALARVAPRGRELPACVAGALAVAALDLEVIGRRLPRIRALPQGRQWADHVAFGAVVGAVLAARRRARAA
jgi:hypothetical protein